MAEPKFRHEFKHYINLSDYFGLRNRLRAVAKLDKFVGDDGTYTIRSIYFDNIYDKALLEKLNGINRREKFRLRYYNDNIDFIKLEKKSKINGLCLKESVTVSEQEVREILKGNYDCLKSSDENSLMHELYRKIISQQLRPRTIVDYTREAYIFPAGNVRVTIDSNIRTGMNSIDFLNPDLTTLSTGKEIILEVKYDEFIPRVITDIVQSKDRKVTAFSKYAACRIV